MTIFKEYTQYDGLGLAELVRTKQVSAADLLETAISKTEALNPKLNAINYKLYDLAEATLREGLPDGQFTGVPFLLKDLNAWCAGVPSSGGNRILKDISAPYDSEFVKRLKATGINIFGRTTTPEFGITPFTEPELWGAVHNPWNLDHTAGGSSGGSAAAVAAGIVPIASAGDGGGSTRIPASCCGIFGLKPSRGRVPTGPDRGELWRGFSVETILSRSVRDSAAMLDAISGTDTGTFYAAPHQPKAFLDEVNIPISKLRIAFTKKPFLSHDIHSDCLTGLDKTVQLLQALGHELIEVDPQFDGEKFAINFMKIIVAETYADLQYLDADLQYLEFLTRRKITSKDCELSTYCLSLLGGALSAGEYADAARQLQFAARKLSQFCENYDLLLTPTLAHPPVKIGALQPSATQRKLMKFVATLDAGWLLKATKTVETLAKRAFWFSPNTAPFNVSGQPAMSVPLHWNPQNLPIGMQFAAPFGREDILLRLATQLEQAQPWGDRPPNRRRFLHSD